MVTFTSTEIISAITEALNTLASGDTGKDIEKDKPERKHVPQKLSLPPIPGSTVHAQAWKAWINNACGNVEGSQVTLDNLGVMARVGACIADPDKMLKFVKQVYNVDLIIGPEIRLAKATTNENGTYDRTVLEHRISQGLRRFYKDHKVVRLYGSFDGWRTELLDARERGDIDDPVIECLEFWDIVADDNLFTFCKNYFVIDVIEYKWKTALDEQYEKQKTEMLAEIKKNEDAAASQST